MADGMGGANHPGNGRPAGRKLTVQTPGLPIGIYKVSFDGIDDSMSSQYGPGLKWVFTVLEGPMAGRKANRITSAQPSPKNSAGRMIAGVAGRVVPVGEEVDISEYIGQVYQAIVTDPKGDGSYVDSLIPVG